jgi:hypothetical protein
MQSENFRALIEPIATVHRIIWLAFLGAVLAYVGVAYDLFDKNASGGAPLLSNPLTIPFVIISLLCAVLAPYVPRSLLPDSRLRQLIDQPPEVIARDPRTGIVDEERLAKIRTLSSDERRLLVLVRTLFVGFIVRLAFNESISLYGMVLAFISRSFVAVLPFAIVSFVLNLMVPSPLDEALKRAESLGLQLSEVPTQPR